MGMRHTDKVRFKWAIKASEINWKQFVEGKHLVNHLSNMHILTNKFHFCDTMLELDKQLKSGAIQSCFYSSTSEFILETFKLSKSSHLINFLAKPSKNFWVIKNTSADIELGITLVEDVAYYKKQMVFKVRRGPREKLQSILETGCGNLSGFESSDEDKRKSRSAAAASSPTRTPAKSLVKSAAKSPAKRRPKAKQTKHRTKIAIFEKVIIQQYLAKPALYMGRKFDVRMFMVILCSKPFFVFAAPGFARVCLENFTMANFGKKTVNETTGKPSGLPQRLIHETKLSVQRRHSQFKSYRQNTTISIEKLKENLISQGLTSEQHFKE